MANVRSQNNIYIDAAGTPVSTTVRVSRIILRGNGGGAVLELKDNTPQKVLKLNLTAADGVTEQFLFDKPVIFHDGIVVSTATTVIATIILDEDK